MYAHGELFSSCTLWAKTCSRFFFSEYRFIKPLWKHWIKCCIYLLLNLRFMFESSIYYIYPKKKNTWILTLFCKNVYTCSISNLHPFFFLIENEGYECSVKRIKELTKKSVSAVPHTLYQIQSYAKTKMLPRFLGICQETEVLNSS